MHVLLEGTGWDLKPEGLCLDDRCIRVDSGVAVVQDEQHGLTAIGPQSGARALSSARLPDLELPDRHGRPFSLRSLRGTRFVMIAWASW
jgi:hypothetical protein